MAENSELQAADIYLAVVERFVREYGAPLPKRLLEIGDKEHGWFVQLNTTTETVESVEPFCAAALWNGWPAGVITPYIGGFVAAGDSANASTLVGWLEAGHREPCPVPDEL